MDEFHLTEREWHVISGVNGSGKSRLLERIFREEAEKGGRSIIFLKAPSRVGSSGPIILPHGKVEPSLKTREILYRMLSSEMGPHLSSEEIPLLLLSAYERGALTEGALLLIDELDAGLHPSSEIALLANLEQLFRTLSLTVVFTTESLVTVRGAEELLSPIHFFQTQFGIVHDVTGETEILYRELARGVSSL